ncbi:hypothetical protein [Actinoplanes sp. NPDC051859]|uniref:hypothetical protein n=1 Tax=Actinoplanes sp. NPDC051859 TaxID=3363909 RepID=UPI0037B0A699
MSSADLRNVIVVRQRELASRHEVLGREGRDPGRYEDLLLRVFDATNDLMRDLDRLQARTARRRRLLAAGCGGIALVLAVLVATAVLPSYGLIGAAVAVAAAVVLGLLARAAAPPEPPPPGSAGQVDPLLGGPEPADPGFEAPAPGNAPASGPPSPSPSPGRSTPAAATPPGRSTPTAGASPGPATPTAGVSPGRPSAAAGPFGRAAPANAARTAPQAAPAAPSARRQGRASAARPATPKEAAAGQAGSQTVSAQSTQPPARSQKTVYIPQQVLERRDAGSRPAGVGGRPAQKSLSAEADADPGESRKAGA